MGDGPSPEEIQDARDRCAQEIRTLHPASSEESWRQLVLACNIDVLDWILGDGDEESLGIRSWEELGGKK